MQQPIEACNRGGFMWSKSLPLGPDMSSKKMLSESYDHCEQPLLFFFFFFCFLIFLKKKFNVHLDIFLLKKIIIIEVIWLYDQKIIL